jgi:hypothetical protein
MEIVVLRLSANEAILSVVGYAEAQVEVDAEHVYTRKRGQPISPVHASKLDKELL